MFTALIALAATWLILSINWVKSARMEWLAFLLRSQFLRRFAIELHANVHFLNFLCFGGYAATRKTRRRVRNLKNGFIFADRKRALRSWLDSDRSQPFVVGQSRFEIKSGTESKIHAIIFWHQTSFVDDLVSLMSSVKSSGHRLVVIRQDHRPAFERFLARLAKSFGNEVLFVHSQSDYYNLLKAHRNATKPFVWLMGIEMLLDGTSFARFFRLKLKRSPYVLRHLPWADQSKRWELAPGHEALASPYLRKVAAVEQRQMIPLAF